MVSYTQLTIIFITIAIFYRRRHKRARIEMPLRDRILWGIACSFLPLTYNINNGFKSAIDYCFIPIGIFIFIVVFHFSTYSAPKQKR